MRQLTISQTKAGVDRSEFLVTEDFHPAFRATGGLFSREHGLELIPIGRDEPAFRLRYDPGANLCRALTPRRKTWAIRRGDLIQNPIIDNVKIGSSRKPGGFPKTRGKVKVSVRGLMPKNAGQPFIAVPLKAKP